MFQRLPGEVTPRFVALNNSAFSSLFSRDTPDGCDYSGEFEDEKPLDLLLPIV